MMATRRRCAVLIIDEDREFAAFLADVCEEHGFSGAYATSAADVARELAEPFDVLVTEVDMRAMDGIAVIRAHEARANVAIIATAFDYASARRAIAAGAGVCLRKPFHVEELLNRIAEFAERIDSASVSGTREGQATFVWEFRAHAQAKPTT